jgi:hypothetical protein
VYDPTTGEVILVGGATDQGETLLGDTWHYLAQTGWMAADPVTDLPARAYHQAVYDSTTLRIILFSDEEVWGYE